MKFTSQFVISARFKYISKILFYTIKCDPNDPCLVFVLFCLFCVTALELLFYFSAGLEKLHEKVPWQSHNSNKDRTEVNGSDDFR